MGNVVVGIVQGAGQLVAEQAVAAANHEGAAIAVQVITDLPLNAVRVTKLTVWYMQANGGVRGGGNGHVDARVTVAQGGQLFAGHAAMKGVASIEQLSHCCLVGFSALALVAHGFVPVQPEGFQLRQDMISGTGCFPGRIQVINANQPLPSVMTGLQPAGQGRHQ